MHLSKKQISQLVRIIETTQEIIAAAQKAPPKSAYRTGSNSVRTRRTGADLVAFKKAIKAERKAGASVVDLARKHGVTPSYIYQL